MDLFLVLDCLHVQSDIIVCAGAERVGGSGFEVEEVVMIAMESWHGGSVHGVCGRVVLREKERLASDAVE